MALTLLHAIAMQTPWTPDTLTRFAESRASGSAVRCVTTVGGPTTKTTAAIKLPPISGAGGTNHWESKQFTLAQPSSDWQFGFWVYFDGVDIHASQNSILFYQMMRNGLPDIGLELRNHASGHELHLIDANGSSVDSALNPFSDDNWTWIEAYKLGGIAVVLVSGVNSVLSSGDFTGDATGDDQASMYFDGQTDTGTGTTTIVYISQGYFADGSSGTDDLVTFGDFISRKFECTTFRLGATSTKADENDVDGNGDNLSAGALVDTADDTIATTADYIGTAGATPIGASWAFDTSPGDGPAPHFNKWETCLCMKFMWHTSGGTGGGTRTLRYGNYNFDTSTWDTASVAVANRIKYTEVFGLPGAASFPDCPSENEVAAMGWFIHSVINTLALREAYFWVFGYEGEGEGSYLMKSKPIKENMIGTGLVGDGAGRVG